MSFLKLCAVCCGDEEKSRSSAAAQIQEPDPAVLISRGVDDFDDSGNHKQSSKISFGLGKVIEYEVESEAEVSEDSSSGSETDEGEDALVPKDWVELQKSMMGKGKKPSKRSSIPSTTDVSPVPSETAADDGENANSNIVRDSAAGSTSASVSEKRSAQRGAVVAAMKKQIQDSVILRLSPRSTHREDSPRGGRRIDGEIERGLHQSETVHQRVSTRFIERRRDTLQFAPPPSTGILRRESAYKNEAPDLRDRTPAQLANYYGITPNYDYT